MQKNPILEITGHKTGSHEFKKSIRRPEPNKEIEIKNQDVLFEFLYGF